MAFLLLLGAGWLLYLVARAVFWAPRRGSNPEAVGRHAFWTGTIAWLLSGLAGAANAGILTPPTVTTDSEQYYPPEGMATAGAAVWQTLHINQVLSPVAAVLVIFTLGQLMWPAPKAARRRAELAFRRVRDFTEPALAWVTATVFLVSAGFITAVFFAPAYAPRSSQSSESGNYSGPMMGRVPGWQLSLALGAALLLLALGTAGIMWLTARRRSLESLTFRQNRTLRTIGINRLLRVSATVASGLGVIAGAYLAVPNPAGALPSSTFNIPALLNIVVLIIMVAWKPPVLVPAVPADEPHSLERLYQVRGRPRSEAEAAAGLSDSTTAAVLPAVIVAIFAGALLISWLGALGPVTAVAVAILLTLAGLEHLLRRNYTTPGRARRRLARPLPWPMAATLVLSLAGILLVLGRAFQAASLGHGGPSGWGGAGGPATYFQVPAGCAAAVTLAGALAAWLILSRPGLNGATPALDDVLRRRALFRTARTTAGGWFAILGVTLMALPAPAGVSPLSVEPDLPALGAIVCAVAVLVAVFPVPPLTGALFTEGRPGNDEWGSDGETGAGPGSGADHASPRRHL